MRYPALVLVLLASCLNLPASIPKDASFQALAKNIVEEYLRFNPEFATRMGDHRWDDRLPDYSAKGRNEFLAWARSTASRLRSIPPTALSPENRVDREILIDNLDATIQDLAELKRWQTDPGTYNPADAIDGLLTREILPLEQRLRAIKGRLLQVREVLAAARVNLVNPPLIYTETAIQQFQGTLGLVKEEVTTAAFKAGMKEDLAPAQAEAAKALEDFIAWMKKELLPRSSGNFRIGPAAFRKALRYNLSSSLSPEAILARAEGSLKGIRAEMFSVARPMYEVWFPDQKATHERDVIKAVLDRIAQKHPTNDTIVALASQDLIGASEFVRKHNLVTIPDAPVKVIVMPEYARGTAVAYCDSPGPLEANGTTFFAIAPTPADWSPARVASFFGEYNNAMVKNLTVHEAMPGHYLQLAKSNTYRGNTAVRSIFSSGIFTEGWAVYSEKVMAQAGFGGPEVRMQQLKMRLRVTINAILDQKIHTQGMTESEALALMKEEGFQEEGEAVGKWKRACLTSTQLSTYFVGAAEMDDLRAAAEAKAKRKGVPFNLCDYHDEVLSHGSPAPKFLRLLMRL